MKSLKVLFTAAVLLFCSGFILTRETEDVPKLENPFNVSFLKKTIRKSTPRLVLTPAIEKELRSKIKTDPVVGNYYSAMSLSSKQILDQPLLTRKMEGRRLLGVSREMLYRMNILCMLYRLDHELALLKRIDDEVKAVCNFSDWNPSHYLDVAEMSLAIALAVDWVGRDLPQSTYDLATTSLIEKGIKPSYNEKGNTGWISNNNNWNQVCNGGMIAASIAVAEKDPELAAKTIARSLDGMPNALAEYGPDGVYPEGATYWGYGTSFSVITSSILESAFGKDFGLANYPAFLKSVEFRMLSEAPSQWYFNFADCGDKVNTSGDITLAWFANKTGNSTYVERDKFLRPFSEWEKLSRLAGAGLVWLSQIKNGIAQPLPLTWQGKGANPVVFFRSDDSNFYFGGKGGRGSVNHGNMDAGSFVFELNGVRWSVDPGNQDYNALEQTGFDLWSRCQTCERWTLLTKNNFGHSTITVNDQLHFVDGYASLVDFKDGEKPQAAFDLTPVFGSHMKSATRKFIKESNNALLIEDQFEVSEHTKLITWQMMTTADVDITKDGATLSQDGKQLNMRNLSWPGLTFSVISLDPPPLKLDRRVKGLKRIELRIPAYLIEGGKGEIRIQLGV